MLLIGGKLVMPSSISFGVCVATTLYGIGGWHFKLFYTRCCGFYLFHAYFQKISSFFDVFPIFDVLEEEMATHKDL